MVRTSPELMLEIGWKSFGNRWPVLKSLKFSLPLRLSLKSLKNLRQSSEVVGQSSEVIRSLRKPLVNLRKFRFCADEKSRAFYWKKVGRCNMVKEVLLPTVENNWSLLPSSTMFKQEAAFCLVEQLDRENFVYSMQIHVGITQYPKGSAINLP